MIGLLPVKWQAIYWAWYMRRRYGETSHFRIEAMRALRKSANITLKEAKDLIDWAYT